jgi:hypothetical protein
MMGVLIAEDGRQFTGDTEDGRLLERPEQIAFCNNITDHAGKIELFLS